MAAICSILLGHRSRHSRIQLHCLLLLWLQRGLCAQARRHNSWDPIPRQLFLTFVFLLREVSGELELDICLDLLKVLAEVSDVLRGCQGTRRDFLKHPVEWCLRFQTRRHLKRRLPVSVRSWGRTHGPLAQLHTPRPSAGVGFGIGCERVVDHLVPGLDVPMRLWVVARAKGMFHAQHGVDGLDHATNEFCDSV